MTTYMTFLLLGLGGGAVYAALGMSIVSAFRSSGVINFGTGAIAMYGGYAFAELRGRGDILNLIPVIPARFHVGRPPTLVALLVALLMSAALGVVLYLFVFRLLRLRGASALSNVVASLGIMTALQAWVGVQVGSTDPAQVAPIFPTGGITIGGARIPKDRLCFAVTIVVISLVMIVIARKTKFGLATRAVAENEKGAVLLGLSPQMVGGASWAISGVVAGLSGALISPIVPLTPASYTLFIVPALAAALVGNLKSLGSTVVFGFALGMVQAVMAHVQFQSWYPSWLGPAFASAIPLIALIVILMVRGKRLPIRGSGAQTRLPTALLVNHRLAYTGVFVVIATFFLLTTHGGYRSSTILSIVYVISALSLTVVTGYVGQISLAQVALAGVAAFLLSRLTADWGVPFPLAPLLAAGVAAVLGVLIGIPALRIRGFSLAIVTLAAAVALEALYFNNHKLSGGLTGGVIKGPRLFGWDLTIGAGESYPRLQFGFTVLFVAACATFFVMCLRASPFGRQMLAVRANERAAAAGGIDVAKVKLKAFAIGSFLAGLGGSFSAYALTRVSAESFGVFTGISLLATVYLAGVSSITGALFAGLIAPGGLVTQWFDRTLHTGKYYEVLAGYFLVMASINHPGGITHDLHKLWVRIGRRRHRHELEEPVVVVAETQESANVVA